MRRPVVGVIGNAHRIENRFAVQMVGERNLRAVADVAGALPLALKARGHDVPAELYDTFVDAITAAASRAKTHA